MGEIYLEGSCKVVEHFEAIFWVYNVELFEVADVWIVLGFMHCENLVVVVQSISLGGVENQGVFGEYFELDFAEECKLQLFIGIFNF